ncbi:GNAT family protein [Agromyces sp. H66]|uniref:GNAT family N-acetyltransferase n=1 Tax=Agromyces sp. H66 TaxID=2529859 RepID=UPI0020BF39E3|nr:GNAT family protein [Agromyces sp. H66]
MIDPIPLVDAVVLRELHPDDAGALAEAYARNRAHLAAWEPERDEAFFTTARQATEVEAQLEDAARGGSLPTVLAADDGTIVGRFTLSGIVRGPFRSANLGYWVDAARTGHGLASAAVAAMVGIARDELGLHRIQAATLTHNAGSRRVLERNGFAHIGFAPSYLKIAGRWQDHELFQRILHD